MLNGILLNRPWLELSALNAGATLILEMGPHANTSWVVRRKSPLPQWSGELAVRIW